MSLIPLLIELCCAVPSRWCVASARTMLFCHLSLIHVIYVVPALNIVWPNTCQITPARILLSAVGIHWFYFPQLDWSCHGTSRKFVTTVLRTVVSESFSATVFRLSTCSCSEIADANHFIPNQLTPTASLWLTTPNTSQYQTRERLRRCKNWAP